MNTWKERPQDLKPEELNAWALAEIADALYNLGAELQDATSSLNAGLLDAVTHLGLENAVSGLESISEIAISLNRTGNALRDLGTANAATEMGSIEFLATQIKEGLTTLASSIEERKIHDD